MTHYWTTVSHYGGYKQGTFLHNVQ